MGNEYIQDNVWDEIVSEVDTDGSGKIDFKTFEETMLHT